MALPCLQQLEKLHDAILALQTGQRVTSIAFGERSVQYGQGDLKSLQQMYRIYYRSCGADSGLPDISDQAMVLRGPPAFISSN